MRIGGLVVLSSLVLACQAKTAPTRPGVAPATSAISEFPPMPQVVPPAQTVHLVSKEPNCMKSHSPDSFSGFPKIGPVPEGKMCDLKWNQMRACESTTYTRVRDLNKTPWPAEESRRISVGGYLHQVASQKTCSYEESPVQRCRGCGFCMDYLVFVDFDEETENQCNFVSFSSYESSGFLKIFDAEEMVKRNCLLGEKTEKVVITADAYKDYFNYWSFSEVHSICRLP